MGYDLIWEQETQVRPRWAEAMFLHMRRLRYGISPCKDCDDEEVLDAQLQVLNWQREKKIDEGE
jgi:hypothetical protein